MLLEMGSVKKSTSLTLSVVVCQFGKFEEGKFILVIETMIGRVGGDIGTVFWVIFGVVTTVVGRVGDDVSTVFVVVVFGVIFVGGAVKPS